ncbi:hypothetical protein [Oleisolibacter albus]|uniref:hypothetical protein n=1 Tax=Oleisolibacter albus TaxID=2171757 RepID=UPI000DF2401A|nr:hypothetical protein [Oleisolibacter albus]
MRFHRLAALAAAGLITAAAGTAPGTAAAATAELRENQAHTVQLDGRTAVIYFTRTGDDFTVVTTAANETGAAALRTIHTLKDGESVAVQLSSGVPTATRLDLTRTGTTLSVDQIVQVAAR